MFTELTKFLAICCGLCLTVLTGLLATCFAVVLVMSNRIERAASTTTEFRGSLEVAASRVPPRLGRAIEEELARRERDRLPARRGRPSFAVVARERYREEPDGVNSVRARLAAISLESKQRLAESARRYKELTRRMDAASRRRAPSLAGFPRRQIGLGFAGRGTGRRRISRRHRVEYLYGKRRRSPAARR